MTSPSPETTALLSAARNGRPRAADLLFERVYNELRRLARKRIAADSPMVTISATELVHEAYLKLVDGKDWEDRAHFMAIAARAMRQILIDRARARGTHKRGGSARAITLQDDLVGTAGDVHEQILNVDAALNRLAVRNEHLARLVELRFFGGLDVDETAEVLGVSPRTAARQWARAKAHLRAELA